MQVIQNVCENVESAVRVDKELVSVSTSHETEGQCTSSTILITYLEGVMDKIQGSGSGPWQQNQQHQVLDNIDLIQGQIKTIRGNSHIEGKAQGLKINIDNTKSLIFRMKENMISAEVDGEDLGSVLTWDNNCGKEVMKSKAQNSKGSCSNGGIFGVAERLVCTPR